MVMVMVMATVAGGMGFKKQRIVLWGTNEAMLLS